MKATARAYPPAGATSTSKSGSALNASLPAEPHRFRLPISLPQRRSTVPVAESVIAASIAQSLLAEFETQAAITRRFLERLPEDKLTWQPHEKSMTAGQLAYHLAFVPGGVVPLVQDNTATFP